MKLYSYIIATDSGFAPNPFWGYCTLATCKPQIRKNARVGDWIMAAGSKSGPTYQKLVYAMRADEVMSIARYAQDGRFTAKMPVVGSGPQRCGDNIYFKDQGGEWKQRPSFHNEKHLSDDLSGLNVLVSEQFYYFGRDAIEIPAELRSLVAQGRGYQCKFSDELVGTFVFWLQSNFKVGVFGEPLNFRDRRHLTNIAPERRQWANT